MGGEVFYTTSEGSTPKEAFHKAVQEAAYFHGHGGYTGTIAEKDSFIIIPMDPAFKSVDDFIQHLINSGDPRIDDKWGPAGCIKIDDDKYIFFGWASC